MTRIRIEFYDCYLLLSSTIIINQETRMHTEKEWEREG